MDFLAPLRNLALQAEYSIGLLIALIPIIKCLTVWPIDPAPEVSSCPVTSCKEKRTSLV